MASTNSKTVAVIGSGPAGLMAADMLSGAGLAVTLIEKRKAPGRKLLIAGSSGLNIGNSLPLDEFLSHYSGPASFWRPVLEGFPPSEWLRFVEELGHKTFEGSSGRYFVDALPRADAHSPEKGSKLLHSWIARLEGRGVSFRYGVEVTGFESRPGSVALELASGPALAFSAALFALGGGSWEPQENPVRWPRLFQERGVAFREFRSSNCGFQVAWPEAFLAEAEGLPLKTFTLATARGTRKGEAVITRYGIEGTPVYAIGAPGPAWLDLKPDLSEAELLGRLEASRENLSPIRRVKKLAGLSPAALALLFHLTPKEILSSLPDLVARIKRFPLELGRPQPLAEAISSSGGISLDELDPGFMLKRFPGVFAAGEMLDWDAPTGGFLIQACVSQGHAAGRAILDYLRAHD
jgi:hypothetical protein